MSGERERDLLAQVEALIRERDIRAAERDRAVQACEQMGAQITALRALLREAAEALAELASDVAVSLENEYPSRLRNIYPSMERKYDRDMGPVRRARAVLAKLEAHDATDE